MKSYTCIYSQEIKKKINAITKGDMLKSAFSSLIFILERDPFYSFSQECDDDKFSRMIVSNTMPHKVIIVYIIDTKDNIVKILDCNTPVVL